MEPKKLIVLFPGASYSNDRPLLYFTLIKYIEMGYEYIKINYPAGKKITLADIEQTKTDVLAQVKDINFSVYADTLFVSKSIGGVFAFWLAETLGVNVRHVCLTPIPLTLPNINGQKISLVVAGDRDKYLDSAVLKAHCEAEAIRLEVAEGACHSLEIEGDVLNSITLLKKIIEWV